MKIQSKAFFVSALAVLVLLPVDSVLAQTSNDSARGLLEEIIVTARKREESLQDVPVAITAMSDDQLSEAGIDDIRDLFDMTAGMVYNDIDGNRGTALPGIRGVKSFTSSAATDQRVSSFIDGMPLVGSQATIQLVDIEAVEIYRGPQSAVFGRSVFGGAINYTTRKPSHDGAEGGVNVTVGQDARRALSGWFSAPITEDTLAFSVSASNDSYDGPGSIVSNDGVKMGERATSYYSGSLSFKPTDNVTARLRYSHTDVDDGPAADYNLDPAELTAYYTPAPFPGPPKAPLYTGELQFQDDPVLTRNFCYGDDPDETFSFYNCIEDPGWEMERDRLEFDVSIDIGDSNLTFKAFTSEDTVFNIDDQDNSDINQGGVYIIGMGTDTEIEEDYVEVVWTSPDDNRLRYTLGASNYKYDYQTAEYFGHPSSTGIPGGIGLSEGSQEINNTGVFGGLFFDLGDSTTVSIEGRWQEDDIAALLIEDEIEYDSDPEAVTDSVLPRFALNHALSDEVSVYAQVAKGVQPATVNAEAAQSLQRATAAALEGLVVDGYTYSSATPFLEAVQIVDEEELWNYEIGTKGVYLDGQLSLNAALFLIEIEGYAEQGNLFYTSEHPEVDADDLVAALEATGDPDFIGLEATGLRVQGAVNIADLTTYGAETEFAYLVGDHWTIDGALTYLKSEFDTGCAPIGDSAFGIGDSTITLPGGYTLPCTDISGNAYPFTPELQAALAATFTASLGEMDWFARLDVRYEDKQYMDWFESGWIPSSTRWNFRAGLGNDSVRAEVYIENLTDDRTPVGADYAPARNEVRAITGTGNPPFNTGLNVAVANPREAGFRVSYSF